MSEEPRTVIITGVTGRQGGGVARALAEANAEDVASGRKPRWRLVGVSRDPTSAPAVALSGSPLLGGLGLDIQRADAMDRSSLDALLARNKPVYAFYAVTNPFSVRWSGGKPPPTDIKAEEKQGENMIDACAAAGVQHFVLASSVGATDAGCDVPTLMVKARLEAYLARAASAGRLPCWTVIAPAGFFENMQSSFAGLKQGVVPGLLRAGTQMQMVSAADVGAFVRLALEEPAAWAGKRMEVAGDTLTSEDMAATLSRLRGGEHWRVQVPPAIVFILFIPRAISTLKRFLENKTSRVDVAACRKLYPDLLDFEGWCRRQGYASHVFDAPAYCAVA